MPLSLMLAMVSDSDCLRLAIPDFKPSTVVIDHIFSFAFPRKAFVFLNPGASLSFAPPKRLRIVVTALSIAVETKFLTVFTPLAN